MIEETCYRKAIILVHGIHDFRFIGKLIPSYRYFKGLTAGIAGPDVAVYFPRLPNAGRILDRGQSLAAFLDEIPENELHIIAHSMGGLDARYVIHSHDAARRIKTLVTIATPHRGTAVATWANKSGGLFAWILRKILMPGLDDLTPSNCNLFNNATPDREDVTYRSYVGHRQQSEMPIGLRRLNRVVSAAEGSNDGVVSRSSASWGTRADTLRADHAELVGWSLRSSNRGTERPFNHRDLYNSIVATILEDNAVSRRISNE